MTKRKFVLNWTFSNVNDHLVINSPIKEHFGYEWYIQIRRENLFAVYLVRNTKEEDMPPVDVVYTVTMNSTNGEQVKREADFVYCVQFAHGFRDFGEWDTIQENFVVDNKLTIEIEVEIVKIYAISSIQEEFTLTKTIEKTATEFSVSWTPFETHAGLTWALAYQRDQSWLRIALECTNKRTPSNNWSADVKFTYQIKKEGEETCEGKIGETLHPQLNTRVTTVILWDTLIEKYMVDGKAEITVRVEIFNVTGIPRKRKIELGVEDEAYSDVIIKAGGRDFKANKAFLARASPVFHKMFFGQFVEAKSKEVTIEDVEEQSFSTFISLIYNYEPQITSENVKNLLVLADRYDVSDVTEKCSNFLLKAKYLDMKIKITLADEFRLDELLEKLLNTLKTFKDVTTLGDRMEPMNFTIMRAFYNKIRTFS